MRPSWLAAIVLLSLACNHTPDGPPDMDAPPDWGVPPPVDGSAPPDASQLDGSAPPDGSRPDGGMMPDGGPTPDGGMMPDGGPTPDGGDAVLVDDPGSLMTGVPRLQVSMIDVGQGDGLLVQLPGGNVLAIDGGPSKTSYLNSLNAMGIKHVDYAVLTHAHSDHYTGITPAISALMPMDCTTRIFDPGMDRTDVVGYPDFKTVAGCRYQKVDIGETLNLDPAVEVTVLSAHDMRFGGTDDSHAINNTSVVVRLRYQNFSMLFEGDAEEPAEQATAMAYPTLLRSTVLKAGHHGSCTASGTTYLGLVAPQYLLMSMANANSYGMPHCQTIAKLKARPGLRWARTDVNGSVNVITDGMKYAVTLSAGASNVETCPRDCAAPLDF